jgi:hypothetical protein
MGGCKTFDVVCWWFLLFFWERGLVYVTEEAGRKYVRVYAMAASGQMQYDYKQTNNVHHYAYFHLFISNLQYLLYSLFSCVKWYIFSTVFS